MTNLLLFSVLVGDFKRLLSWYSIAMLFTHMHVHNRALRFCSCIEAFTFIFKSISSSLPDRIVCRKSHRDS